MPFSCSNKPQKRPCKQIQQQERGELSLTKNGTHKIGPHCQKQTQRWPISRRFLPLSKHKHVMPCYSCRPKSYTRQKPVDNKVAQTSSFHEALIAILLYQSTPLNLSHDQPKRSCHHQLCKNSCNVKYFMYTVHVMFLTI